MDEKALLSAIEKMMDEKLEIQNRNMDEKLESLSQNMDEKLEIQNQKMDEKLEILSKRIVEEVTSDLKEYIRKNNVAIGEVLTQALEKAEEPKNTLYRIIPVKC